jgi:hypothetical protein
LSLLEEHKLVSAGEKAELLQGYRFLRDLEHKLQMVNELQAHELPEDEDYDTIGGFVTSTLGRIPRLLQDRPSERKEVLPGDIIVMCGGRIGKDGIHGATFSSGEMTHQHETIFSHACQRCTSSWRRLFLSGVAPTQSIDPIMLRFLESSCPKDRGSQWLTWRAFSPKAIMRTVFILERRMVYTTKGAATEALRVSSLPPNLGG